MDSRPRVPAAFPRCTALGRRGVLPFALVLAALAAPAAAQTYFPAHPGPSNNGLSTGAAIFFEVLATSGDFTLTELTTANSGSAGVAFTVEVLTRPGTALGGPVASGAGSSTAGWTSLGVVNATQGPVSLGESLPIDIPDIGLPQG